jgi:hypothetical protein
MMDKQVFRAFSDSLEKMAGPEADKRPFEALARTIEKKLEADEAKKKDPRFTSSIKSTT